MTFLRRVLRVILFESLWLKWAEVFLLNLLCCYELPLPRVPNAEFALGTPQRRLIGNPKFLAVSAQMQPHKEVNHVTRGYPNSITAEAARVALHTRYPSEHDDLEWHQIQPDSICWSTRDESQRN
jgi:hypothetical protein